MSKIEEAQSILRALGLPPSQQNEMSALTLLALCGLRAADPWSGACRQRMTVTKGIMAFVAREYGKEYAPNTRETFRRQVLHQFVQARTADYNPFEPARVGLVSVSAFPAFAEFRKHLAQIAWETEVWIAEIPDHIIHFNGDRFLGPR